MHGAAAPGVWSSARRGSPGLSARENGSGSIGFREPASKGTKSCTSAAPKRSRGGTLNWSKRSAARRPRAPAGPSLPPRFVAAGSVVLREQPEEGFAEPGEESAPLPHSLRELLALLEVRPDHRLDDRGESAVVNRD